MDSSKVTKDFNKSDWADSIREGNWRSDYSQEIYKMYLNVKNDSEILYANQSVSFANSLILRYSLDDFFKSKNLILEKMCDLSHDSEYPASFSNIEYEQKKYKSCISSGSCFIKGKDGELFILKIENRHEDVLFSCASTTTAKLNSQQLIDALIEYASTHNFLKGKKIDASCNFIYFDRPYTWDDLVLSDELKKEVRQNLSNLIEYRSIYAANNLVVKRGLIFSGPPGTGKSLLGKILCQTIDWSFVWVTSKHISRPQDVARIIGVCRDLAPTVLFLEDVDLFAGNRDQNADNSILGELMNQLDGIQENKDIITIATTNKPDSVEKALIDRPGRFDKVIEFKQPDDLVRKSLITYFTKNLTIDPSVNIDDLVNLTHGFVGAQLREFVNFAVINAIDNKDYDKDKKLVLQKKHFKAAVKSAKKKDFSRVGFTNSSKSSTLDYYLDGPDF